MNLKQLRDELLAQAARNVSLANTVAAMIGDVQIQIGEVASEATWKDFEAGDRIRVTFVDGSIVDDVVSAIEHYSYTGDLPICLEERDQWIAVAEGTQDWMTNDRRFVKLEKLA